MTKESVPPDFRMWNYDVNRKDVYRINVEDGKMERITDSKDTKNGYVTFSEDGKKVLYVSDRNGISNIYYGQFDSTGKYTEKPITNSISPIDQLSLSKDAKKLLFVSLNEGGYDIYSMDNPFDRKIDFDTLPPTDFVKKKYDVRKSIFADGRFDTLKHDSALTFNDSLTSDSTKKIVKLESDSSSYVMKSDSLSIYGSNIKLKLNSKKDPGQKYFDNFDSLYSSNNNFKVNNQTNEDGSFKINNYKIKFSPDIVYGNAMYSSYYGVQGVATISLSDMLGNHRITFLTSMVIDLKNSDYAVGYQYLPKRIDYGIQLYHTARFVLFDKGLGFGSELYRYRTIGTNLNLSYPINKFRRLDAGLSFMSISRENLDNGNEPTQKKYYLVPSVSLAFDNALYGYIYPEKGSRYYLTTLVSPHLGEESSEFYTLIGDFRHYFKLGDNYSFAMRFNGGASFGKNPQKFYLGGVDNWINWQFENSTIPFGESIDNYAFASIVTPLRGFNYNAETGSKFVLANIELRFPIFKYLILGALPLGFQNIMGCLFLDAGSAWNDTKDLKFTKTNLAGNTVTKDLMLAPGFGSRIIFLGFPVRFDVAWRYNLQRFSDPMYMFSLGLDY
jgi:hypothetical protein